MEVIGALGSHVNIINLIGCCTQDGPIYVVVEYAAHGNLRDFLRDHRPPDSGYERPLEALLEGLTCANLVSFAYQVARGMEFLAGRKIVHRDLAARNVLVAKNFVLKIADFGLTRYTSEEDYYRLSTDGRFPVKWMAPESLIDRKYSSKSDIWSFGVLLWEVFTLGGNPYPTVRVENLVQLLRDGHRMEPPPYASVNVYSMMLKCWQWSPRQRPSFPEVVKQLDSMVAQAGDSEYLNLEPSDLPVGPRTPRPSDSQYSSMSNASMTSIATPIQEAPEEEDESEDDYSRELILDTGRIPFPSDGIGDQSTHKQHLLCKLGARTTSV
jgi:serine/threonine protein kinase